MEGTLQCWALAVQEFNFDIVYRRGTLNTNANALFRKEQSLTDVTALTSMSISVEEVPTE